MIRVKFSDLMPFVLGGLTAGLLNGLLGAGGGIIAVLVLGHIQKRAGIAESGIGDSRDLFANALAAMLPVTVISLLGYLSRGGLDVSDNLYLIIPAIIGGTAGALLLDRLSVNTARRIFTVIVILSGIVMLVRDGGGRS